MSNLVRWNPVRDLVSMTDAMDRLFDEAFILPRNGGFRHQLPALDLVENGDNFVVKAELPGFTADQVDVRIEGNTLTLRGEIKEDNDREEGQYHVRERRQNSFVRSITLPATVNSDKANAEFENGVLTLTLPKHEAAMPKKISIAAKSGKK
jgi:HSP20 family protein